ncbi:MAG: ribosome silencing factor [Candidatus Kapaibacterium sp.]|jgi:ribosome-associated protein
MTKQQDSITTPTKRTKKSVENPADSSITKVAPKAKRVVKISTPSAKANVVAETNKKKITKGASKTTLKKKADEETAKPKAKTKKASSSKANTVADDLAAAWLCAKAMLNKKGDEVIILDLREAQSAPADFFVICTCESTVQSKAVASEVDNQWRSQGWQIGKSEGWDAGEWIILDYFDVVVHVFLREKRDYFKLEKLWSDGVFYSVKEDGTIHPIQRK